MPEFISINKTHIAKGENVQVFMDVARLPTRNHINIPVNVHRAKKDGPVLLLLAGMHGNEINGIEILRKIITDKKLLLQKGTLITIPIINIFGFINFSRETPDGKDLNRSFPGTATGSLASRIAYNFTKGILPLIDIGLDFHTGGDIRTNYPQVRYNFANEFSRDLAYAMQPPFILNAPLRDKSLRKEAAKYEKPILVYEGGESQRFDKFAISEGVKCVQRLMNKLGMADIDVPEGTTTVLNNSAWVRARAAGLFMPRADYGERIRKNQVIAEINGPYGEFSIKHKSPANGWVVGINRMAVVNEGDALFHIGSE